MLNIILNHHEESSRLKNDYFNDQLRCCLYKYLKKLFGKSSNKYDVLSIRKMSLTS